jgi:hypothetical protein
MKTKQKIAAEIVEDTEDKETFHSHRSAELILKRDILPKCSAHSMQSPSKFQ